MPERSRTIPISVKNGIASSVSFFMMPNNPQWQRTEQVGREQTGFHADETEQETGGRESECNWNAGQQKEEQAAEHQRHEVLGDELVDHLGVSCGDRTPSAAARALASSSTISFSTDFSSL